MDVSCGHTNDLHKGFVLGIPVSCLRTTIVFLVFDFSHIRCKLQDTSGSEKRWEVFLKKKRILSLFKGRQDAFLAWNIGDLRDFSYSFQAIDMEMSITIHFIALYVVGQWLHRDTVQ